MAKAKDEKIGMGIVKCPDLRGKVHPFIPPLPAGFAWANRKKDGQLCCVFCGHIHEEVRGVRTAKKEEEKK